jgi:hypothetical protein
MKIDINADLIVTLEGCDAYSVVERGVMRCYWTAKMAICCDGMPVNTYGDPCYQSQTAYYNGGKFVNADYVPYIVVPPQVRNGVEPVVMGCQGVIINLKNGRSTPAMVGDEGPSDKIGEASCEAARRVGLSGDPNNGGTSDHVILYIIWPGIAAHVDGKVWPLQPS